MSAPTRPPLLLAGIAAAAVAAGCSTARPPSELQQRENVRATPAELRHRLRSLAPPFAGILEDAAERIELVAATREERLFATRLKVEGVPALFAALFRSDPVEAFIDTWVLTVQMTDFFTTGRGASLLSPPPREIALAACGSLQEQLRQQAREAAPGVDFSATAARLRQWAGENPIRSLAARPSTAVLVAGLVAEPSLGAAQAAGKIAEDLNDLGARMDFMTATLPKQARWQAEQLLLEAAGARDVRALLDAGARAGADASRAVAALDRAIALLEGLPAEARSEREAVLRGLRGEREAVLASARGEREALQAFVSAERRAALETLAVERAALLKDFERQRRETVVDAVAGLERLAGRIVLQLALAALVGGGAVAAFAFALGRRSRPS